MATARLNTSTDPAEYFRSKLEHEIYPGGLHVLLENKAALVYVIDVRDRQAYDDGHIPGSRSIPADELVSSLSTIPKDRLIVAYCSDSGCGLAPRAALELAEKGFRVQVLVGGVAEWSRHGFELEFTAGEAKSQAW